MANRQVTYTLLLDDQFSGPLKRSIAELRREMNSLYAEAKRGGGIGGGVAAPAGPAGSTAVATARPGGLSNFGPDQHLKELVSRVGYTNRLLEKIANAASMGGGGGGPPVPPGPAGPRSWAQWGSQTRIGGMQIMPNDPRRMMGAKIGMGVVGAGVMSLGEQWKAEAERKMAIGIQAEDSDLIDKAAAGGRWGSSVSAGGKIMAGAAVGAAGGPLGMIAGAAGGAIHAMDDLATAITGISQAAEDAKIALNAISPADKKRREYLTMTAVEQSQQKVAGIKFRAGQAGMVGDLDASRAQSEALEFARREASATSNAAQHRLSRMGGVSANAGVAAAQAGLAESGVAAAEREMALMRQKFDLTRETMNLDIRAAEVSRTRYQSELESIQQQIRLKEREVAGQQGKFGQLNRFDQGRVAGIAAKFEKGETLSRQDEVFARGQSFFERDFEKLDQQRAKDSGLLTPEVQRRFDRARGEPGDYTLDQLKGQETNVKVKLDTATKIIVETNFDKAKLEKDFADAVKPVISKIEELAAQLQKMDLGRIATSTSRKAASQ